MMNQNPVEVEVMNPERQEQQPRQNPNQAVTTYQPAGAGAVGQAMSVNELKENLSFIKKVMVEVMKEGADYGKIPGCGDKPGLFQPGAQKLLMTFQLTDHVKKEEIRDLGNYHREYAFIITVRSKTGREWDGVGTCSTLEAKYRYRGGARKCPKCGKETIIKGKKEYGGGWLCFTKKGGCGEKWEDGAKEIEGQTTEKVENENPADYWNTVRKMGFKRALVHASINATNTSELWSQDLEDLPHGTGEEETGAGTQQSGQGKAPAGTRQAKSKGDVQSTSGTKQNAPQGKPAPQNPPMPTEKTREWMLMHLKAEKGQPSEPLVAAYFKAIGKILPNETLSDLPCRFVAGNHAQLRALGKAIADFEGGAVAKEAFAPHVETGEGKTTGEAKKPAATPAKQPELPPQEEKKKEPPSPEVTAAAAKDPEWFFDVIVHVPPKGMKKIDYMKNPHTIGWLYEQRHDSEDARKRLFGFVHNYEAAGWTDSNQKFHPPTESDKTLRLALDAFAEFEEKHKNDTEVSEGQPADPANDLPDDPGDDVPY